MSDSLNNKELVAVGHHLAKALSSDTPIIDIAKVLSRLAERLDCTTAALHAKQDQRDQLAAENAVLKSAIETHSESIHFCELCGKDDPCSTDDVCMALSETPATDAYLAEMRAQGVRMFAQDVVESGGGNRLMRAIGQRALKFAAKVRQGDAQ